MTPQDEYEVLFTPTAHAQALGAAEYIANHSPSNALKWYEGLVKAIESLKLFPNRCAIAPESYYLDQTLRHFIFKSHCIIFRVEETTKTVRVLHVRHDALQPLGADPNESA